MMNFKADQISVTYQKEILLIRFSETSTEAAFKKYFLIQDSEEYSDQEKDEGLDIYYLEIGEPHSGMHGGIRKIYLYRNKLEVLLNNWGVQHFGFDRVEIDFEYKHEQFLNLVTKMQEIFSKRELKIAYYEV